MCVIDFGKVDLGVFGVFGGLDGNIKDLN